MKILSVVGTRPNFVKIAPFIKELDGRGHEDVNHVLVHTGQHFGIDMMAAFFEDLVIPIPDYNLGVSEQTHAKQVGNMMIEIEEVLIKEDPNIVVVVGDCNSTLAGALAASKLNIPIAHIEAGLRSFDNRMPEEMNRILTDHMSTWLFTTEGSARDNLIKEGLIDKKHFVGNIMIDTLFEHLEEIKTQVPEKVYDVVVTLHRPSNVDFDYEFFEIMAEINRLKESIVFTLHPRILKNHLIDFDSFPNITFHHPFGYLEFLSVIYRAKCVITDSGGIQEETSVLGVPCITLRRNTERPVTLTEGTNVLCKDVRNLSGFIPFGLKREQTEIPLWDGKTAKRIVDILLEER